MKEADNRLAVIKWIESAMAHAEVSQARLNNAVWPHDRSILGKILKNKRRAQIGELAEIAAKTDYPPYPTSEILRPKRDPMPRLPLRFYVREWREFCEVEASLIAKALRLDEDDVGLLETKPHRFSIEQLAVIAKVLKVEFDSLRWNPKNLPAPPPADKDIERIKRAMRK